MFADRNLINWRNVTSDVSSSYRPNRDFFWVVFQSRVIGAAISVLGFENRSHTSIPSKDTLPENLTTLSKASKLKVLHELSASLNLYWYDLFASVNQQTRVRLVSFAAVVRVLTQRSRSGCEGN